MSLAKHQKPYTKNTKNVGKTQKPKFFDFYTQKPTPKNKKKFGFGLETQIFFLFFRLRAHTYVEINDYIPLEIDLIKQNSKSWDNLSLKRFPADLVPETS